MFLLPAIYLFAALFFFTTWFRMFQKDTDLSPEQKNLSIKLLIVATLFWPIVVPISYLEKHSHSELHIEENDEMEHSTHSLSVTTMSF